MKVLKDLSLLRIFYKEKRSLAPAFIDYFKHQRSLSDFNVAVKNCEILHGVNIVLLIDRQRAVVYRYALNALGRAGIVNNFKFLTNSKLDGIPVPIKLLLEDDHRGISAESFMPGRPLKAGDVNDGCFGAVLGRLFSFYRANVVHVEFEISAWFKQYEHFLLHIHPVHTQKLTRLKEILIKKWHSDGRIKAARTYIHGDLTFRNVLVDGNRILFFDFDRSAIDFPEFDVPLFYFDQRTHQNRIASYDVYFDYIMQFIRGETDVKFLEDFYKINPVFSGNKQMAQMIRCLFLYRALLFSLYDLNEKDGSALNRFDRILHEASGKGF